MKLLIYFIVSLILLLNIAIAGSTDVWLECGTPTCQAANPPTCQKTMGATTYYCCPGPTWTTTYDCSFDFSVSVSPTSGSVAQGNSITATVTVSLLSGVTQLVSLSASVSPSVANGPTVSLTPSSGNPNPTYTSTLNIATTSSTPSGTYTITVTGTGGGLTRTATYTLTVTSGGVGEVCNDYPIDNDGDGLIDCNDPDCTGTVYCPVCTPTYVNNCDSTDGCGYTRPTGSYNSCNLAVAQACGTETACNDGYDNDCDGTCDTNGCGSLPADPDCYVPPGSFNFAVSLDSTSGSVVAGSGKTPTVTVSLVSGTAQTVSLTWAISPSVANGPTVSLTPSSGNPTYTRTLTISTTGSTPAGTYTITVTGTGGGLTRTATYTLTVSSVAGCGNTICELGETQENCATDCKTTVTISPRFVNPGDTATVTVSFSDSRFNPALNDANITLKIDGTQWTNCVIDNKKWKGDMTWNGGSNWVGSGTYTGVTIESSNYNGKIIATCTIPSGTAIGVHTLVAKPTIYSEPIELKGSETKIVVMDGFLKLLRFLVQPLKLLF